MQAEENHPPHEVRVPTTVDFFPSAKQLFAALLIYFAAHTVIRTLVSSSVDLDEADQLVLAQKWSWGYGPQPPLYTWIQIGFFQIFGMTIFALALWKFILLFATHALTYVNARFITRSHMCGVAATLSLFLFHQIAWESVRDLTHSVLATTVATATLFTLMRVQQKRTLAAYLLFGVCAGLGIITKYNYVVVLGGLTLAAVSVREYRPAILNWRFAVALGIAALIFLPNGLWMLAHRDLAFSSEYKFQINEGGSRLQNTFLGFKNLLTALATYFGLFAGVLAILLWRRNKPAPKLENEHEKLLFRMVVLTIGGFALSIILLQVTGFRDRWFQPIFVSVPVLVIAAFRERIDRAFMKWLMAAAFTVMLVVLVAISTRVLLSEKVHFLTHLNNPYDELAAQLRPSLTGVSTVVCDEKHLAGNLRLLIPGKIFVPPELVSTFVTNTNHCALIWEAIKDSAPPTNLTEVAKSLGLSGVTNLSPQFVEATYKHYQSKKMRLGFVILEQKSTTTPSEH